MSHTKPIAISAVRSILNPNGSYIHRAVSGHFFSSNYSHKDMLLIPLELLKSKLDCVRKAREVLLKPDEDW